MRIIVAVAVVALVTGGGCANNSMTMTDTELESFFRSHTVDGNHVVALKKRSAGAVSYLATIHGYPSNLSVCEQLIEPYNKDQSTSALPGEYFCEELR